jgi:hypothetical protein
LFTELPVSLLLGNWASGDADSRKLGFRHTACPETQKQGEAERMLVDDALWILEPSLRFAFSDEEAVEKWRVAVDKLEILATLALGYGSEFFDNDAVTPQCIADAEERAREALRRARQRARGAA